MTKREDDTPPPTPNNTTQSDSIVKLRPAPWHPQVLQHCPAGVTQPVDLDETYDGDGTSSDMSSNDYNSDSRNSSKIMEHAVGGGGGGESKGEDYSFETSEKHRMSALTHTLAEKQLGISEAFCKIVHKMTKMVRRDGDEGTTHINTSNTKTLPKTDRDRSEYCKEMQDVAILMANKQARIAQQFEALVFRLEQEAIDREVAHASLTRELQIVKLQLREEKMANGLHKVQQRRQQQQKSSITSSCLQESPTTAKTALTAASTATTMTTKIVQPPQQQNSSSGKISLNDRSGNDNDSSYNHEIFQIKEISFSNTLVDVGLMDPENDPTRISPYEKTAADILRLLL